MDAQVGRGVIGKREMTGEFGMIGRVGKVGTDKTALRTWLDEMDVPCDETKSLAMFQQVMVRLEEQQQWSRWARRVAGALAALAGAQAVRMFVH